MITEFEALGISLPIFGFSHCRDVVVAVSKAGGLGVYGASMHTDEEISIDLNWIEEQLDGKPYGIDLMMPEKYVGNAEGGLTRDKAREAIPAEYQQFLDDMMDRYHVPEVEGWEIEAEENLGHQRHTAAQQAGILKLAFASNAKLLVAALGTPPSHVVAQAHSRGMLVGALAGKVSHALKHKAAGVDLIIAQSYEAGGHTGDIGGMVLWPEIIEAVAPVPVLAAGGIATGRQMAAALALGAKGVWCGTIWLATLESECSPVVRQKLVAASSEDTIKTKSYTGKPARYLKSRWIDEWEGDGAPPILPTPLQSIATGRYVERIDRASALGSSTISAGAGLLANKPAGQVIGLIKREMSCREVIHEMLQDCAEATITLHSYFEQP